MRKEIFDLIAQLIAKNNDIPVSSITMDSTFEDLDMDSLDAINLVNDLENAFGVSVPNHVVMRIRSVREAVENLESLLVAQ